MSIDIYSHGIVYCSVCAPSELPIEEVTVHVNRENPTTISTDWALSEDETFSGGEPNPSPCERGLERTHYLFEC